MQSFILGLIVGAFGAGTCVAVYLECEMMKLDDKYRKQLAEWKEKWAEAFTELQGDERIKAYGPF